MSTNEWKRMGLRDDTQVSVRAIDKFVHLELSPTPTERGEIRSSEFTLDEAEAFLVDLHGALEKARAAASRPTGAHRLAVDLRRTLASVTPVADGSEAFLDKATAECVGALERAGVFGYVPFAAPPARVSSPHGAKITVTSKGDCVVVAMQGDSMAVDGETYMEEALSLSEAEDHLESLRAAVDGMRSFYGDARGRQVPPDRRIVASLADLAASQRDVVAALIEVSKQNAQLTEMVVTLAAQNRNKG